jgi:LPXTG-site transpeptidase (sortase) family protein
MNPLFADEPEEKQKPPKGYVLARQNKKVNPINPAVELIRSKIDNLYEDEPNAKTEVQQTKELPKHASKHQKFMHELSTSGRSLAEIQQTWHNYYSSLPDDEKHEVWQEFYEANERHPSSYAKAMEQQKAGKPIHQPLSRRELPKPEVVVSQHQLEEPEPAAHRKTSKLQTIKRAKKHLTTKIKANEQARIKAAQHLKSLVFGLSFGLIAIVVILFGFFNEVVIARLIQPNAGSSETPIILSTDGVAPSDKPEVIIPKINVQLPIVFGASSTSEDVLQDALDKGVIHYPGTSTPGQKGNSAYFGHSSNNIFNQGEYKFAFVLLSRLVPGDIFYITYEGKAYTYKVYDKRIVSPDETWVLSDVAGRTATAALITCDPPGTTINRLVVWGEQISPNPSGNSSAPKDGAQSEPAELPAQGPTLWGRFWNWVSGE